mgnify:CR=1 FL=1
MTKKDPVDEIKIEKTSTSKDCGDTQVVTNQNETGEIFHFELSNCDNFILFSSSH